MLDHSTGSLTSAHSGGWALAAFSTYSIEQTDALLRAAESQKLPVVLQAGSSAFGYAGRAALAAAAAVAAAREASVPVGVHLDHSRSAEEIAYCIEAGYTSVMIDGSHLPFEANVALTASVVGIAHDAGVWVEGELGSIAGDEDVSGRAAAPPPLTDPVAARDFVRRTGVDCLAVAVGNVHGFSAAPLELDIARLAEIREACDVPLVLHGASGLSDDVLRAAIDLGVAKVNINTELRKAFIDHLDPAEGARRGYSFSAVTGPAVDAVAALAAVKLQLLGPRRG